MKQKLLIVAAALATFLILTVSATFADTLTFVATLSGANEVPSTGSAGTGSAVVVIDTTANTMLVNVTFSGLTGNTTASHIHCCLASPFLSGVNVGVATTTPTFTGFPLGVTSGTYSHFFDLTLASSYNPAFNGGTGQEALLLAGIENGETYLNIHTTTSPTGEIRGFLAPSPEPGSILLMGSGLVGLFCTRWRGGKNS